MGAMATSGTKPVAAPRAEPTAPPRTGPALAPGPGRGSVGSRPALPVPYTRRATSSRTGSQRCSPHDPTPSRSPSRSPSRCHHLGEVEVRAEVQSTVGNADGGGRTRQKDVAASVQYQLLVGHRIRSFTLPQAHGLVEPGVQIVELVIRPYQTNRVHCVHD